MSSLTEDFEKAKQELSVVEQNQEIVEQKPVNAKVDDLVGNLMNSAIISTISNDESIKNKVVDTAKTVIDTKIETTKVQADTENKQAHFNNNKSACECYGYEEDTTEKWAVRMMAWGHNVMTALWIIFGWFSFMPITFVTKKIHNIVKHTWLAILIAVLIYGFVVIGLPLITTNIIKG